MEKLGYVTNKMKKTKTLFKSRYGEDSLYSKETWEKKNSNSHLFIYLFIMMTWKWFLNVARKQSRFLCL